MYKNILVNSVAQGVCLITLNRPLALNALNTEMLGEIAAVLNVVAEDSEVKAVVFEGSVKAFAAGADVNEMAGRDLVGMLEDPRVLHWKSISDFPKPIVASVNGFALGGGCELAMCADIIVAGDNAKFGQPEINLGIIPGAGGTQRLLRAVGKSRAMQMVLTGEAIDAVTASMLGLISEITPPELTTERAVAIASQISNKAPLAIKLAKEALLKAFDTDLATGLRLERIAFTALSGTKDRHEGIKAFQEKRKAQFSGS